MAPILWLGPNCPKTAEQLGADSLRLPTKFPGVRNHEIIAPCQTIPSDRSQSQSKLANG